MDKLIYTLSFKGFSAAEANHYVITAMGRGQPPEEAYSYGAHGGKHEGH